MNETGLGFKKQSGFLPPLSDLHTKEALYMIAARRRISGQEVEFGFYIQ